MAAVRERVRVTLERNGGTWVHSAAGFDSGKRGLEPRRAGGLWKLEQVEMGLPKGLQKKHSPVGPAQTSGLWNHKGTLHLGQFVR